jgi:hypothetical protein
MVDGGCSGLYVPRRYVTSYSLLEGRWSVVGRSESGEERSRRLAPKEMVTASPRGKVRLIA